MHVVFGPWLFSNLSALVPSLTVQNEGTNPAPCRGWGTYPLAGARPGRGSHTRAFTKYTALLFMARQHGLV